MSTSTPKLRVENLRKSFGPLTAVDDVSLVVEDGDLKSLLGPSGCGKTTTLRCIAGLERPDSGRIYIDGDLVSDPANNHHVPPEDRNIGMVFQSYAVWPHMTVWENVMYPLQANNVGTKADRREKVQRILDTVGLGNFDDHLSSDLSGGQQQRVSLARALVLEPEILLFDEPLSNLDAKLRREMRTEINNIHEEFDIAVLYVTHSQDEAMFLSDEIVLLNEGRIVERGTPDSLHNQPKTLFAMEFMGRSNTVVGEVKSTDSEATVVETPIGTFRSTVESSGLTPGLRVSVCFRPKHASVLGTENEGEGNVFDGTLMLRAMTRDFTEYYVDVAGEEVLVRTIDNLSVEVGDPVRFAVDPTRVRIYPLEDTTSTDHAASYGVDTEEEQTASRAQ